MTLEEFKNQKVGDVYWLYMEGNTETDLVSFKILNLVDGGYNILISLNQSTKNHYYHQHDEFFKTKELCYIAILKEEIRKHQETEERALRKVQENRNKMEEFKSKLSYEKLLEQYPEEFL